jgi:hypothetical protein
MPIMEATLKQSDAEFIKTFAMTLARGFGEKRSMPEGDVQDLAEIIRAGIEICVLVKLKR